MQGEHVVVEPVDGGWRIVADGADGRADDAGERIVPPNGLGDAVRAIEARRPRWVLDTGAVLPALLAAGTRIDRAHDLRLTRALLRRTGVSSGPEDAWDRPAAGGDAGLFRLDAPGSATAEWARQRAALDAAPRLRTLVHADAAGALAAAEMRFAGLPWRADEHDRILTGLLGSRPGAGERPARIEALAAEVRRLLAAPDLNPESPDALVRALRRAGLDVRSTRAHDLERLDHPVAAPLVELKRLSRLHAANGWQWLDRWVRDGRFRPEYVVAGVPTGRWATSGGGALQLPKQLRAAVVADLGWRFVVADAAQLEPRVLAGMARDTAMAAAGRGRDLYDGIVEQGGAPDRSAAKYAMLGALYGATSGRAGALVPRLAARCPAAIGLVERAARTGEAGGTVETLLGRPSPRPGDEFRALVQTDPGDGEDAVRRSRSAARDHGRFTRNFVVQGTAAEWALAWLAELRRRLAALSAEPIPHGPHLVYFLHDEVVVHTPAELADAVVEAMHAAAARAGRVLFGDFPIDFPLDVAVVERYSDADDPSAGAQDAARSLVA